MTRFKQTQLAILGSLLVAQTGFAQPVPATEPEPVAPPDPAGDEIMEVGEPEPPVPVAQPQPQPEPAPESSIEPEAEAGASVDLEASQIPPEMPATWSMAVAPRLGLAVPTSKLGPFVSLGLELGYRLPVMEKRVSVLLDVAYTRPSHSETANDMRVGGDADFSTKESEIKFGLGGSFRFFGDDKKLVPWAGGAAVLQRLKSTQTNDLAPGENTSQDTKFGGELFAGADYELGPGYALGEARLVLTDLNDLITGNSNAGNVNLSLGYRLVF